MTYEQKEQIIKRLKSLGWRLGAMVVAFIIASFADEILPMLEVSPEVKTVIGLMLGEVTKYLNS